MLSNRLQARHWNDHADDMSAAQQTIINTSFTLHSCQRIVQAYHGALFISRDLMCNFVVQIDAVADATMLTN